MLQRVLKLNVSFVERCTLLITYQFLKSHLTRSAVEQKGSSSEVSHTFATGDTVQVAEGELMHLLGTIISVDGNKITMMPKHEDLKVNVLGLQSLLIRPLLCRTHSSSQLTS